MLYCLHCKCTYGIMNTTCTRHVEPDVHDVFNIHVHVYIINYIHNYKYIMPTK